MRVFSFTIPRGRTLSIGSTAALLIIPALFIGVFIFLIKIYIDSTEDVALAVAQSVWSDPNPYASRKWKKTDRKSKDGKMSIAVSVEGGAVWVLFYRENDLKNYECVEVRRDKTYRPSVAFSEGARPLIDGK